MSSPVIAIIARAITLIAAMSPKLRALLNLLRHEIWKMRMEPTQAVKTLVGFGGLFPDAQERVGPVLTGIIN